MSDREQPARPPGETGAADSASRFPGPADEAALRHLPRGLLVVCLSLLVVVLVAFIFRQLSDILRPLFIAAFLGYLIMPAHRVLVRLRIPPVLSYGLIVLLVVVMIFGFVRVAYTSASTMQRNFPVYAERIEAAFAYLSARFDRVLHRIHQLKASVGPASPSPAVPAVPAEEGAAADEDPPAGRAAGAPERDMAAQVITREYLQNRVLATLLGSAGILVTLLVVVVYLAFLLAEAETIERRVRRVFGGERGGEILEVIGKINRAISAYIAVKTGINLMTGVLTTVVLLIFGVDFAIFWGIVAFLFNFIPYVGSVVAVAPPVALAFLQFGFGWHFVAATGGLLAIQNGIGYVVEPRMTGRRLDLSPLVVLLALAFWGWLWGVVGMILAVPIAVSLRIIFEHIPAARPIAGLMSEMPAGDG